MQLQKVPCAWEGCAWSAHRGKKHASLLVFCACFGAAHSLILMSLLPPCWIVTLCHLKLSCAVPVFIHAEHWSSTSAVRQSPESYGLAAGCPFANGRGNQPSKTPPFQACCSFGYNGCHCLAVDYRFSSMLNSQHYVSAKEQGSRLLKTPRGPLELLLSTRETWLAKSTPRFSKCASNFLLHQSLCFWTPSSCCRRRFLTGTRMPGQVYLSKQCPLSSEAAVGCCSSTSLWWF